MNFTLTWNLRVVALIWLACAASIRGAGDTSPTDFEAVAQAIAGLDSDRFEDREAAMLFLWRQGESVGEAVAKAMETGNPEVRMRAKRILEAFQLGVTPDTPKVELGVIYDFHRGDERQKVEAIRQLCQRGDLPLARRLIRTIPKGPLQVRLIELASASLKRSLQGLLEAGAHDKALETLAWMAIDDNGIRDYAAFAALTGQSDLARVAMADPEGPAPGDWRVEAWLLRAEGRMEESRNLGRKEGDLVWEESVQAAGGDPMAYLRGHLLAPGIDEGEKIVFEASLARLGGDDKALASHLDALRRWAKKPDNLLRQRQAIQGFLLNDRLEEGMAIMNTEIRFSPFKVQTDRSMYREALNTLGIDDPHPPFEAWLSNLVEELKREEFERFPAGVELATHLYAMGETAEAGRIFQRLFENISADPDRVKELIREEGRVGAGDLMIQHLLEAKRQGIVEMDQLLALLPASIDVTTQWWEFIRQSDEGKGEKERLETLWHLLVPDPAVAFDAAGWIDRVEHSLENKPDGEKAAWYTTLYATAIAHQLREKGMGFLKNAVEARPTASALLLLGENAAEAGDWEASLKYHEAAWQRHQTDAAMGRVSASVLYLYGRALSRAGREAEGNKQIGLARLLPLGDPAMRHQLAATMEANGDRERALEEWHLAARLSNMDQPSTKAIFDGLAEALGDSDPAAAARYQERAILEVLPQDVSYYYTYFVRIRMQIQKWLALAAARENRFDDAARHVEAYFQIAPGNASIGEELLPMLEAGGRLEQAKVFYEKTRAHCLEAVALYPGSAMALNNLAWLDARSRRKLDEALEIAKRAVAMKPGTPAYIDTLAEVHFVRGDRQTALKFSQQAVDLAPDDKELKGQLERFKSAPLPEARTDG